MRVKPVLCVSTLLFSGCSEEIAALEQEALCVDTSGAIESAVRHAAPGDSICIASGVYALRDPLLVTAPITIEGRGEVILVGSDHGPLLDVDIASGTVRVANFGLESAGETVVRATGDGALEMEDVRSTCAVRWASRSTVWRRFTSRT